MAMIDPVNRTPRWRWPAALGLTAICAAGAGPALAQEGYAREVVQALPHPSTETLNNALRALSRDPVSFPSLIDAGQASLDLDNVDAALGFFRRAEAIAPHNGAVKAGLASVLVRQRQPVPALQLFAEAEAAGEPMARHAADRGLAYDLVGDNARAQQDYRLVLASGPDSAISQRLALSQAIAGDQRASEATLLPLLQRSDLAAYRTRAFALAIVGRSEEAVSIAETMLPERLSSRLSPYLRFMPRLTPAQQAAAANLGVFPQAADIGRDGPELAAYANVPPPLARPPVAADARLVPSGAPLGSRTAEAGPPRRPEPLAAASPPATPPAPLAEPTPAPPPVPTPVPVAVEQPLPAPAPVVVAVLPPEPAPPPVAQDAQPSISLAAAPALPEPTLPEPAAQPRVQVVDLAEIFGDLARPGASPAAPAPGAVDITRIEPRREARPEPAAAPAPPPVPSREWVQVATGRDQAALAFDWRRIRRNAGGLLDRTGPHIARWGQTNRLVAGPFGSAREAQAMVASLKERNIDSFRFTSARGEAVEPLD